MERSRGRCEAVGPRYGHPAGVRCEAAIAWGAVNFDHYPRPARDPHPETRQLGNCLATCPACNQYANNHEDTPREAKMKRVQKNIGRRALDIDRPPKEPPKMKSSRGFAPGHRPLKSRSTFQRRDK